MPSNRNSNESRRIDERDDYRFDITRSPAVQRDLGAGDDKVRIEAPGVAQIRITFTGLEVGNGNPNDSNTLPNQDGGLAVRVQAENAAGNLVGPVSRFDDEGIQFKAKGATLFDVRDLVTGASRGLFDEVILGTSGADKLGDDDDDDDYRGGRDDDDDDDRRDDDDEPQSYYINGGMGNDRIYGGPLNDFLVGGAGNDRLFGRQGNDIFIGGFGDDRIRGGTGDDTALFNISVDGSDQVNLGAGLDIVRLTSPVGSQVRITFNNAEVGNDNPFDSGTRPNQDGGLAVRLQLEDASGNLIGPVSRFDDEGISFIRSPGQTFDVRSLVNDAQRGDQFDVVRFGTSGDDMISDAGRAIRYYTDGGGGNDTLIGGTLFDTLVGGLGNDRLDGRQGNDNLVGGAGADTFIFTGVAGNDRILDFARNTDKIDLSAYGITAANVTSSASGANTVLAVDSNRDGIADFQITLVGVGAPLATDYIF
ncbi:MAG: hypothetical protein LH466_10220 [Sphingomonas bacterium]|nr:hypothetical protein [Sphingomonas bacterium]